MTARVGERPDRAVIAAHQKKRDADELQGPIVPRLGEAFDSPDRVPGAHEYAFDFPKVEPFRAIAPRG